MGIKVTVYLWAKIIPPWYVLFEDLLTRPYLKNLYVFFLTKCPYIPKMYLHLKRDLWWQRNENVTKTANFCIFNFSSATTGHFFKCKYTCLMYGPVVYKSVHSDFWKTFWLQNNPTNHANGSDFHMILAHKYRIW